jgi:glycosyltransferase involved in cell wall biosynthesis
MPEIAGDAAELFDPLNVESIAKSMLSILSSPEKAADIGRRGLDRAGEFSWGKTARKTLDVIHGVVNS